ncbi:hypothetical protein MBAV_000767 [Candidatus Magnetobacterium bavaricum]|uniref:Uncharacterized protein n=1 Tax=Candidatus Magnetobacterium bavaricum TaxID=29290 RepID=A0A0F3GYI7_9BACT|nr:hypothetical protein MBAV_000767 [Candidatus Magnetobacterium bavaricum]
MYLQHQVCGLRRGLVKDGLKHIYDKLHCRIIIVEDEHLIHSRGQLLLVDRTFRCLLKLACTVSHK